MIVVKISNHTVCVCLIFVICIVCFELFVLVFKYKILESMFLIMHLFASIYAIKVSIFKNKKLKTILS